MNSRGTRMAQRIAGDTLAISDRVAITPTVQPAAAGTQRSREVDSVRGRDAVMVTDGEDIRYCYGMPMIRLAGNRSCRWYATADDGRVGSDVSGQGVVTGRLTARPSPAKSRDSKWSPAPTVGQ
jgi:hypothetical protein